MSEEIKQILDIGRYRNKDGYVENINLLPDEMAKLFDYITSQNKEIERLNKELEEKEAILGGIQQLEAEIERLYSIIKEVREYINKGVYNCDGSYILEILDKVGETDDSKRDV